MDIRVIDGPYKIEANGSQRNGISVPHFRIHDASYSTIAVCFGSDKAELIVAAINERHERLVREA